MIGRIFFELAQWSHHDNSMLVMMIHMCRSHEKPLITNKKQVYRRTYASPSDCPYSIAISLSCMSSRLCALHYVTLILGLNPVQLRRYVRAKLWRLCIPTYSHSFWLGADCYHIVAATNLRRASAATGERRIETGYGHIHHNDVIMSAMAPQITIVYSTVYSGADQRKCQSSALLAFVRGIYRWPVNSPHKGPVTRTMFPFDDVIMDVLMKTDVTCTCLYGIKPSVWSFCVACHQQFNWLIKR